MNRGRCTALLRFAASAAVFVAAAATSTPASANPMDLAPERLAGCDPNFKTSWGATLPCGSADFPPGGGTAEGNYFKADNAAWAKLVSQYAMAIAPTAMHPARTTGYGGFELSLFGTLTSVSHNADFMKNGTEGAITGGKFPVRNDSPDSVLQVYGVTGRKGLPYGFEIEGSAGYVANTELAVLGGGIRLSPFEGFRKGALGVLPDLSVGGYVNTLTGTNKVKMTVPALDVQLSKPIAIANQVVIQPYIGWQMVWIDVDSGVVDATPGSDAFAGCQAQPPPKSPADPGYTGDLNCKDPTSRTQTLAKLDLNNNMVFRNVRFRRQRALVGFDIRWEIAHLLVHGMYDITDPESGGDERLKGLEKQWTLGFMAGVQW
jgi:hypothetical protein